MARREVRQLIDDIDGTEIEEADAARIEFSFQGVDYRIDLTAANADRLSEALKPYIEAAERVSPSASRRTSSAPKTAAVSKEHQTAIREWAKSNGHEVASRGRIKAEVVHAFEAAHQATSG